MSPDIDWKALFTWNDVHVWLPEVLACAHQLRQLYYKLGIVAYCWVESTGFKLVSKEHQGMVVCVLVVHPGPPTDHDVQKSSVPFQFVMPSEMVIFCNKEITELGVDYQYQLRPDVPHGFAVRCNIGQLREKEALELAKIVVVY